MRKNLLRVIAMIMTIILVVPTAFASTAALKATSPDQFIVDEYEDGVVIKKYTGSNKNVVVPSAIYSDEVVGIYAMAFDSNKKIVSVTLPHTVTFVDQNAFRNCKSLKTVILGENTKNVESGAFVACRALKTLYVPKSVEKISADAFSASSKLTIYGEKGSYAEKFVKEYKGAAKLKFEEALSPVSATISGSEAVLEGKTTTLILRVNPDIPGNIVEWKSSNNKIATVDDKGVVTGVKSGNVTITADLGKVEATHKITVTSSQEFDADSLSELFSTPASNQPIPRLAILSMDIAFDAYTDGKAAKTLKKLGFNSITQYNYPEPKMEHGLAHTIGKRSVVINGEKRTLYAVIDRSTHGSGNEWISNLDIGTGDDHLGFSKAGEEVYKHVKELMGDDVDTSNDIVWITGHSRGAAVSNYVAKKLWDDGFKNGNLYGYTYACPTVTKKPDSAVTVFNYCSEDDLIVKIPLKAWGFERHGTTIMLKRTDKAYSDMTARYKKATGNKYKSMTGDQTENFVNVINKYVSTQSEFVGVIKYLKANANNQLAKLIESLWTGNFGKIADRIWALIKKLIESSEKTDSESLPAWLEKAIQFLKDMYKFFDSLGGNMVNAHQQEVYVAWMAAMYAK